jgi:hypothetical protein
MNSTQTIGIECTGKPIRDQTLDLGELRRCAVPAIQSGRDRGTAIHH